jgi:hypothetical protein
MVAKILYLAKRTRPDLLLAISFLTTRVTRATAEDKEKLDRVIGYLRKTTNLNLILKCDPDKAITVITYVDASYGVHSDGRSHTGMGITLGGGFILAKSVKQNTVTKSSTEAELMGVSNYAGEGINLGSFIHNQLYGGNDSDATIPVIILQDNMSTIAMLRNGRPTKDRSRHISIKNFWMSERIQSGQISLEHCPTDEMVSDALTKALQGSKFRRLRNAMLAGTDKDQDNKSEPAMDDDDDMVLTMWTS